MLPQCCLIMDYCLRVPPCGVWFCTSQRRLSLCPLPQMWFSATSPTCCELSPMVDCSHFITTSCMISQHLYALRYALWWEHNLAYNPYQESIFSTKPSVMQMKLVWISWQFTNRRISLASIRFRNPMLIRHFRHLVCMH